MLRNWSLRLFWFTIAAGASLVLAEGYTRVFAPQAVDTVLDILVPDDEVGYIYRPHAVARERGRDYDVEFRINALGLRDVEPTPPDGAFTVMVIGNSFSAGHGVELEDSFPKALQLRLRARAGADAGIRVVNVANAGYEPWAYWKSYRRWAPVVRPDAVVVGYVLSREHGAHHEDVRFVVRDGLVQAVHREGEAPRLPRKNVLRSVRKHLARNSEFYVLMRNFFFYNERVGRVLKRGGDDSAGTHVVDPYLVRAPEHVADGRDRSFDYVARIHAEAARDGVPLVVAGIPRKEDVLEEAWGQVRRRAAAGGVEVEQELPRNEVAAAMASRGIAYVDLTSAVADAGAAGFFAHDNHWNENGIARGARALADRWDEAMRQAALVPAGS